MDCESCQTIVGKCRRRQRVAGEVVEDARWSTEKVVKSCRESRHGRAYVGDGVFSTVGIDPKRMVQLDQFEKYDRGGSIPAPDTEEGCPIRVDRLCPASPRRVGWVTAGKGQRRAEFGGRRRWSLTTRTKTFGFLFNRRFCSCAPPPSRVPFELRSRFLSTRFCQRSRLATDSLTTGMAAPLATPFESP